MTVDVEKRGTRVRYVFLIFFSERLDSIDSLPLIDYKKHKANRGKYGTCTCMSSEEPSRSVDVVQAECGSQFVHFLSQYLLYLHLTL